MAISVKCVKCSKPYRVDDKFAGKQFRCRTPNCNTVLFVAAGAAAAPEPATPPPAPAPTGLMRAPQAPPAYAPPPAADPANTVQCGHCGGTLTNDSDVAGKLVECPHCNGQLQMPALAGAMVYAPTAPLAARGGSLTVPRSPANPVVYAGGSSAGGERTCPMCSEPIKADAKRCKHCGETLDPALRKAEEVERLALSNRGTNVNVNTNTNVVASARSGGGGSTNVGANVALEVLGGFFSIFGIGHLCNGNVGLGLLFMLSYWFLQFINVVLMIVFIGFITFPLTWIAYMIISPIVVAATPPRR